MHLTTIIFIRIFFSQLIIIIYVQKKINKKTIVNQSVRIKYIVVKHKYNLKHITSKYLILHR